MEHRSDFNPSRSPYISHQPPVPFGSKTNLRMPRLLGWSVLAPTAVSASLAVFGHKAAWDMEHLWNLWFRNDQNMMDFPRGSFCQRVI